MTSSCAYSELDHFDIFLILILVLALERTVGAKSHPQSLLSRAKTNKKHRI